MEIDNYKPNSLINYLKRKSEFFIILILTGLSLCLFIFNNTHEELWYKELLPVYYAGLDFPVLIKELAVHNSEAVPPLYYLIIKGLVTIFGSSAFALRTFNGCISTLLLLAIYLFARHIFNRQTAFIAACLFLFNPVTLGNAQEINLFPFTAIIFVSALFAFYLALTRQEIKYWIYYGILILLGIYTHYFTWLLLPGCLVYYFLHRKYWQQDKNAHKNEWIILVITWTAAGLVFIPWFIPFVKQLNAIKYDIWFEPVNLYNIRNIFLYFFTSKFALDLNPVIPSAIIALYAILVVFFNLYPQIRHKKDLDKYLLLLIPFFLPVFLTYLFSLLFFSIINLRNYFLFFPFFIILAAKAFTLIKHPLLKYFMICLFCLSVVPSMIFCYTERLNGKMHDLAVYLEDQCNDGEPVLVSDKIPFFSLYCNLKQNPARGRQVYFFSEDTLSESSGKDIVPGQFLQPRQWEALKANIDSFWIVLVPWNALNTEHLLNNDEFSADPGKEVVEIAVEKSWIKCKVIHMLRTRGRAVNMSMHKAQD